MGVINISQNPLYRRDLSGTLGDYVKQNASWDKCMEHKACKIPVFVGIAVGALILFSVLWCLIRCLACGYACCSCCCGGCGGSKRKRDKRNGNEPLQAGPMPVQFHPSDNTGPQFAYYDTRSEDALPAMPTVGKNEVNIHVPNDKEIEMNPITSRAQSPMGMGMQQLPSHSQMAGPDGRVSPSVYSDGGVPYAGTGYNGQPQQPRPLYQDQRQPPSFVTLDPRASPAPQDGYYNETGYQRNPPPQYGRPMQQGMSPYGQPQHHNPQYEVDDGRRPQQQWSAL